MKIGLFGGSFDPVHYGHLLVAQSAREELQLDRFFFIPTAVSPFKPNTPPLPGIERLRLLRLALAGQTTIEVDSQEIDRGGTSYTIDTLRTYHTRFPEAILYYLIGADNAALLPQWRCAEELSQLARFVILSRPGEPPISVPSPFQGQVLRGIPHSVSSSQIRARVRSGQPIDYLTPPAVAEAIRINHLYL